MTAGLTKFSEAINKYADKHLSPDMLVPKMMIDCPINPSHATLQCAKALSRLEPFGMSNEKPLFSMDRLEITYVSAVGADNNHLRLRLVRDSISFSCIGFSLGALASELEQGMMVDAAFQLDINRYQGTESVQLIIKDLKKSK